jgi:Na+:H+ antiporter, NhaA family
MSLFIGTLAFGQSDLETVMRLGVLVGSVLSGMLGAAALTLGGRRAPIAPIRRQG